MYVQPERCPVVECINHSPIGTEWYKKSGYYKPKHNHQKVPRYQCKVCGKTFSTSTQKYTYQQKKPNINQQLFKMLVSGVSLRRCAIILDVSYSTVMARFETLAEQAKELHTQHLNSIDTSFVMVDELETYLETQLKPLSVAVVIRIKTGEILGFSVAKMPCHGILAALSVAKYGWVKDERSLKFQSMLRIITRCIKPDATFKSDLHKSYPKWITNIIPKAKLQPELAVKSLRGKLKPFDDLFAINNLFAKMRNDMARLGRMSWVTTKTVAGLERHLWLYVAWTNKYVLH